MHRGYLECDVRSMSVAVKQVALRVVPSRSSFISKLGEADEVKKTMANLIAQWQPVIQEVHQYLVRKRRPDLAIIPKHRTGKAVVRMRLTSLLRLKLPRQHILFCIKHCANMPPILPLLRSWPFWVRMGCCAGMNRFVI